MAEILALLILGGVAWFWQDSLRVREIAIGIAKDYCAKDNVQFLDEAVVGASVRLRRNRRGRLAIARTYRFEFTDTGNNRLKGAIVMLGHELETMHLQPKTLHVVPSADV